MEPLGVIGMMIAACIVGVLATNWWHTRVIKKLADLWPAPVCTTIDGAQISVMRAEDHATSRCIMKMWSDEHPKLRVRSYFDNDDTMVTEVHEVVEKE
tara:strand:- start:7397 stop:7690 length:294 start_codon:yes stop_codon:yes gene_type:complete